MHLFAIRRTFQRNQLIIVLRSFLHSIQKEVQNSFSCLSEKSMFTDGFVAFFFHVALQKKQYLPNKKVVAP